MIHRLLVPGAIEGATEVRVLEWHKQVGDYIEPDELLVEFETHKAVFEVRLERPAYLRNIFCQEGDWCPLNSTLGVFSEEEAEPLDGEADAIAARFSIG